MKRSRYFGIHFDFHAHPSKLQGKVGQSLTEEQIRTICTLLHPDFIQTDCKGHPGYASYPSKVGNAMPAFAKDTLSLWRRVTKEEGVDLYLHYSGIWDQKWCTEHPEEAAMRPDGSRSEMAARPEGPYADTILIPQLEELALTYGADGVWVDGECWGTEIDYDPRTLRAFEEETGTDLGGELPVKGHPQYRAYREYCREVFRRYVRRYVSILHRDCPDFSVASNWAYTDHMPEAVSADVDFISGDLNPENSFNSARYAARAIVQQGMPWDLMSWNFRRGQVYTPKHPVQILQEAAAVISQGGGFQTYITQYADGGLRMEEVLQLTELSAFLKERKADCFGGVPQNEVGVLLSTYDRLEESGSLFSRNGMEKIMGMTALLCDCSRSNGIYSEHKLDKALQTCRVFVVPELYEGLEEKTVETLLRWAREGGSLLLCGRKTVRLFAGRIPCIKAGPDAEGERAFTLDGVHFGTVPGVTALEAQGDTVLATYGWSARDEQFPLALTIPCGKGKICAVGADLGSAYLAAGQYLHRELMNRILDGLYEPEVEISAQGLCEQSLLDLSGRRVLQLVNANGSHRDASVLTESFIPPVLDVRVSWRAGRAPRAVRLLPGGKTVPFTWREGRADFCVDRVDCLTMAELEFD
ncbi:MAG: alpha-L-fucosidase [Clostridia bacterium]|nr:alpha-L-fucosidase [Clostridia bacterium]